MKTLNTFKASYQDMDEPKIANLCPAKVEIEAGKKYAYCTCGLSESQPFCDGKHKGTKFVPNVFTAEESKTCFLCQCKRTGNEPHCDGSHKNLEGYDHESNIS